MYILIVYFSGKWVFLVFGFIFRNTLSFLHPFIYLFQCLFLYCGKWTHEAYIKKINKVKTDLIGQWMTYQNSYYNKPTLQQNNNKLAHTYTHTERIVLREEEAKQTSKRSTTKSTTTVQPTNEPSLTFIGKAETEKKNKKKNMIKCSLLRTIDLLASRHVVT